MRYHLPLWLLLCALGFTLCGTAVAEEAPIAPIPVPTASTGKGVVFVADGAGDIHVPSSTLQTLVAEAGLPLCVQRFSWEKGGFRPVRDLVRHQHHLDEGAKLAACILAHKQANPGDRIVLVGHSTGAMVVLAAADCLPAGSVDRIILLAAAVSAGYDLRPALRCATEGIDSFYSPRDGVLSTFVVAFGTADRRWQASGGWFGFRTVCDEDLSAKLRQHSWSVGQWKVGNFGGHFGSCSIGHLRSCVLPLLSAPTPLAVVPAVPPKEPTAPTASAEPQTAPVAVAEESGGSLGARPGLRSRIQGIRNR